MDIRFTAVAISHSIHARRSSDEGSKRVIAIPTSDTMPSKRKASAQLSSAGTKLKKSRAAANGATSSLMPIGERKMAQKGVRDPEMLRMLCEDINKGNERKELHFKKIVHANIDWDSKDHIDKINAWRNQIYGRAGIKNKIVLMWHEDEEAWIELYWQLLVAEANKRVIEMPRLKTIREEFNAFFNGKIFLSSSGEELEPRVDRGSGPFTSKMARLAKSLRPYFEAKMSGKRGDSFYPEINEEMLEEYKKLKNDLAKLGCEDAKIIPWEEVEDEDNDKDYVVRCREYIASLPEQEDEDTDDEEEGTLVGSEELDKELLELATGPDEDNVELGDNKRESSWVTLANDSDGSSGEASPASSIAFEGTPITFELFERTYTNIIVEVVTPRKKRADSVASNEEDPSELTLVAEEAIMSKAKS